VIAYSLGAAAGRRGGRGRVGRGGDPSWPSRCGRSSWRATSTRSSGRQVAVLHRLRHPGLTTFRGVCFHDGALMLIQASHALTAPSYLCPSSCATHTDGSPCPLGCAGVVGVLPSYAGGGGAGHGGRPRAGGPARRLLPGRGRAHRNARLFARSRRRPPRPQGSQRDSSWPHALVPC
jgi:hypothetical protein